MKKTLLILVAVLLIVVISVGATLAYLSASTTVTTNTFVVGNLFDEDDPAPIEDPIEPDKKFVLHEYAYEDPDGDGVYTQKLKDGKPVETQSNEYTVLPGVDVPKDPFIRTNYDLALASYVFVEVVDTTGDAMTVTVDPALWEEVSGAAPQHEGGVVYTLKSGAAPAGAKLPATSILKDNKIVVADDTITEGSVSFYGYLIQKGSFATAAAAWSAQFPATT